MEIAKVLNQIWLKHSSDCLSGMKLVQTETLKFLPDGTNIAGNKTTVAVDNLIAREGETVLVCTGSKVRDVTVGKEIGTKKVIISIVDDFEISKNCFTIPLITMEK